MNYPTLSDVDVNKYCELIKLDPVSAKRTSATVFCAQKARSVTTPGSSNNRAPNLDALEALANEVDRYLRDPKTESAGLKVREQYEADLCSKVHQAIKDLPYEVLDDHKFWQYLAVQYFSVFTVWREADALAAENILTYFKATGVECIPLRLYLRGQAVFEATGKYDLAAAIPQSTDFWRSHILRVRTGRARTIAGAFAEMQRDRRMLTDPLRALARLINRMWANVYLFEYDSNSAKSLLKELRKRSESESD